MLESFCLFAADYKAQMRALCDPVKLREVDCIIQYPFTQPAWETKTEEELARAAERRKEQGKRLQEIAAKIDAHLSHISIKRRTAPGGPNRGKC